MLWLVKFVALCRVVVAHPLVRQSVVGLLSGALAGPVLAAEVCNALKLSAL